MAKPIEILSVGTKTPGRGPTITLTHEDLGAIATAINLSGKPVPFVPGHPKDDQPVLGQATKIGAANGKLLALEYTLNPVIEGVVKSRELNRVSVKLLTPEHPDNGTGTYLLRHIGLLGRSEPADPDIAEIQFSTEPNEIIITMSTQETPTPTPVPVPTTPAPQVAETETATPAVDTTAIEEKLAELTRRTQEIERRELQFSRAQAIAPEIDKLIQSGQVLACEKEGLVALFSQTETQEITLSSGTKTDTQKFLKDFLARLPKRVDLNSQPVELSNGGGEDNSQYEADLAKVRRMYETGKPVE